MRYTLRAEPVILRSRPGTAGREERCDFWNKEASTEGTSTMRNQISMLKVEGSGTELIEARLVAVEKKTPEGPARVGSSGSEAREGPSAAWRAWK